MVLYEDSSTDYSVPRDMKVLLEEDKNISAPLATRLLATLGPSTSGIDILKDLLVAGLKVARFDFSWGKKEFHNEVCCNLKAACKAAGKRVALMADTIGQTVRVINRDAGEKMVLQAGDEVVVTCDHSQRTAGRTIVVSVATLRDCGIAAGSNIFVAQYLFTGSENSSAYLTVKEVNDAACVCVCSNACTLEGVQLTVHFSNRMHRGSALCDDDRDMLATFGADHEIDFVAVSFCRGAGDIQEVREFLKVNGMQDTRVIAKIETKEGLVNYRQIVAAADGVVFSRGHLGMDLPPEKMFLAQKMLLRACNFAGKPVMATRVCDTMTEAPRPTRAEATDVANLVLDGCDGIVLSCETFRGKYPVEALRTVSAICKQAEACLNGERFYYTLLDMLGGIRRQPNMDKTEALASSAVRAAAKLRASLIIAFTVTGRTARFISKYRPSVPILAVIPHHTGVGSLRVKDIAEEFGLPHEKCSGDDEKVSPVLSAVLSGDSTERSLLMSRSVVPLIADASIGCKASGEMMRYAVEQAKKLGLVKSGDRVVINQCPGRAHENAAYEESGVLKIMIVDDESPDATWVLDGAAAAGAEVSRSVQRSMSSSELA